METWKLDGHGYEFVEPWKADMSADNDKLRKIKYDVFEIGDGSSCFRSPKRSCVTDLSAERHARVDAGGVDRVITSVVGRQAPQPRHDANSHEGFAIDPAPNFPNRFHRPIEINRRETPEAGRRSLYHARHFFVADQASFRAVPRRQNGNIDSACVHGAQSGFDGLRALLTSSCPAQERLHPGTPDHSLGRDLSPYVDRAHGLPSITSLVKYMAMAETAQAGYSIVMSASKHRTYHRLQLAAHRIQKAADRVLLNAADVTTSQAAVLSIVAADRPVTQRIVAKQLGLNESALTAMISRLLALGMIERMRDEDDARAWRLKLTADGASEGSVAADACQRILAYHG